MYIIAQTKTTVDIVFYDDVTLKVVTGKILKSETTQQKELALTVHERRSNVLDLLQAN